MTLQDEGRFLIDVSNFNGTNIHQITSDDRVAYSGYLYNNKGPNLTVAEYLSHPETRTFVSPKVLLWEELEPLIDDANRRQYTSKPAVPMSRENYLEMMEVLPPLNLGQQAGMEYFLFAERQTLNITSMYARIGQACVTKYVDIYDRSTWITPSDFDQCMKPA